ncbi:hypothetical protein SAY87_022124 [Trapa incisa]|uniref:Uncharacterized protein n=1 Tax=Trapa incisa TaxID=236973 RepID=A0AAN7JTE3_9MYRT|nr:hypothetical protein SAY87_022124 [Trapa incisa]
MAKRDWQQQSLVGEKPVVVGHGTPAAAKMGQPGPEENRKRLKLTDVPEKDGGSLGHIGNQSAIVVMMDVEMEDVEEKKKIDGDEQQVKSSKTEELYFYRFF